MTNHKADGEDTGLDRKAYHEIGCLETFEYAVVGQGKDAVAIDFEGRFESKLRTEQGTSIPMLWTLDALSSPKSPSSTLENSRRDPSRQA